MASYDIYRMFSERLVIGKVIPQRPVNAGIAVFPQPAGRHHCLVGGFVYIKRLKCRVLIQLKIKVHFVTQTEVFGELDVGIDISKAVHSNAEVEGTEARLGMSGAKRGRAHTNERTPH